jgi:MtN3 and saliva related transmembrane protein
MTLTELTGYCAATLTTVSFLPQVVQALRTKDLSSISLLMYASFCAGIALWLVYGLMIQAWPVVIANIFTLGLAGMVLFLKIRQVLADKKTNRTCEK